MKKFIPVVLVILVGLVFAAVFSCNNGGGVSVRSDTYTGIDTDGKVYELIVTGTDYVLKIDGKKISTGAVSKNANLWTLMPNGVDGGDAADFDVTIAGEYIAEIGGDIIPDEKGGKPIKPGEMVPPVPLELVWNWYTIDDADTNEKLGAKQSIYPPGGVSRITNAVDVTNEDGTKGKKPYEYSEDKKPKDKDGNTIPGPVYNFKGNTKVIKDNRDAKEGAQFPLVGWGAKPADDATLALLRKAYGYSFWVRLNSSTADNWSFLTAVETDFSPELGYEYKHYYGNKPGDSGGKSSIDNFTKDLKVGTWYQIKVIMDQTSSGFNLFQDAWIWKYDSGKDARGDFHQNKAQQLQWQIPLQHQEGAGVSARNGDPYDMIKGSYDFDLDFYGLELIMK